MLLKKTKRIWCIILVLLIAIEMVPIKSQAYDRSKAVAYARSYALTRNPKYASFENNCTNFVSQSLEAGGYKQDKKWYCGMVAASKPWAVADQNYKYVLKKKWGSLKKKYSMSGNYSRPGVYAPVSEGSIIYYQWDNDAEMDHASFVTASGQNKKTGKYETLICQNTSDRKDVTWHLQSRLKEYDKKHGTNRASKCIYYVVDI